MKKFLAILLAMVFIFSMSTAAMALKSPGGTEYNKVVINRTNTGSSSDKADTKDITVGNTIELKPVKNDKLTFNGWKIYKDSTAKTVATAGVDYEIVSVKLSDGSTAVENVDYKFNNGEVVALNGKLITIDIKPLKDVYISEAYENVDIKFNVTSPVTADSYFNISVVAVLCLVIAAAGATAFYSKRSFN